jgi:hypothetical protein
MALDHASNRIRSTWYARADSDFITGAVILIHGGWTAR